MGLIPFTHMLMQVGCIPAVNPSHTCKGCRDDKNVLFMQVITLLLLNLRFFESECVEVYVNKMQLTSTQIMTTNNIY